MGDKVGQLVIMQMCIRDSGKTDQKLFCNEMKDRLNDYYGSRYELRNQPEAVEGRVKDVYKRQVYYH